MLNGLAALSAATESAALCPLFPIADVQLIGNRVQFTCAFGQKRTWKKYRMRSVDVHFLHEAALLCRVPAILIQ